MKVIPETCCVQGRLQVSGKGGAGNLVQAFQKKLWIKSDFTARHPPPLPLWLSVPRGGSRISGYRECIDKVSPSKVRRENFWGILCEKSGFYAKNHIFSNFIFMILDT